MNTLLLSDAWDLTLDDNGNIAMATDGAALAQDAASAIRTFQGEVYYDTTQGVPFWQHILGQSPPVSLMKSYFVAAALTVPEVVKAVCYIQSIINRVVSGQVQVEDAAGTVTAAVFTTGPGVQGIETA
jgi:hypothetical protein